MSSKESLIIACVGIRIRLRKGWILYDDMPFTVRECVLKVDDFTFFTTDPFRLRFVQRRERGLVVKQFQRSDSVVTTI